MVVLLTHCSRVYPQDLFEKAVQLLHVLKGHRGWNPIVVGEHATNLILKLLGKFGHRSKRVKPKQIGVLDRGTFPVSP